MAVYGRIEDIVKQNIFGKAQRVGLKYLSGLDCNFLSGKPVGYSRKIKLDGRNIFAIHSVYESKPVSVARFEAHRKYIDLQYILGGQEVIEVGTLDNLKVISPYDDKKDIEFYQYFPQTSLLMKSGILAVFYPTDAHAPGLIFKKKEIIRKIVVKVRVE